MRKIIIAIVILMSQQAWPTCAQGGGATACTAGIWCQTYNGHGGQPGNFGWNHLIYNSDLGRMLLYAIDQGGQTPFENAMLTYQHQDCQNTTTNPWLVKADTGSGSTATTVCTIAGGCVTPVVQSQGTNNPGKIALNLAGNGTAAGGITSGDTVIAVKNTGAWSPPTFTPSGTLVIQDNPPVGGVSGANPSAWEAVDYTAIEAGNNCTLGGTYTGSAIFAGDSATKAIGNCANTTELVFTVGQRGVRTGAGYEAAAAHPVSANVYLTSPNPRFDYVNAQGGGTLTSSLTGQSPAGDFPSVRHLARNYSYSTSNHGVFMQGGFFENSTYSDTWFLCFAVGGKCTSGLVSAGWQLMTTPHVPDGHGGVKEGFSAFDDTNNAFFIRTGLNDPNATNPTTWINCPVTNSTVGCTSANDWFALKTTCTGTDCTTPVGSPSNSGPPWTHGSEMRYMPDNDSGLGHIIMFGGSTTGQAAPTNTLWIYDAPTKHWTERTAPPTASCPLGNSTFSAVFWPSFAYDTDAHLAVLYCGPGLLHTYSPTTNAWTLTSVPGGPVLDNVSVGEPSRNLSYNSTSQTLTFVQQGTNNGTPASQPDTWELPESAYASPASYSVTAVVSGSGTITSSPAGISCPGTCTASFTSAVTLTEAPSGGSAFTVWSAPCAGSSATTCVVNAAVTVTGTFVSGGPSVILSEVRQ